MTSRTFLRALASATGTACLLLPLGVGGATAAALVVDIRPADSSNGDRYGSDVDASGVLMAAGGAGRAYVTDLSSGTAATTRLVPDGPAETQEYGTSVAVDNGHVVVGSPFQDVDGRLNDGTVYVFAVVDGTWTQTAALNGTPSGYPFSRGIGESVDIASGTIVATGADGIHVFRLGPDGWAQTTRIVTAASPFEARLAPDGTRVATHLQNGATAVYDLSPAGEATLAATWPRSSDYFDLDGDTVAVGEPFENGAVGTVELYDVAHPGAAPRVINPPTANPSSFAFGRGVAISDGRLFVVRRPDNVTAEVDAYDLANPTAPYDSTSSLAGQGWADGIRAIAVSGTRLYVGEYGNGINIPGDVYVYDTPLLQPPDLTPPVVIGQPERPSGPTGWYTDPVAVTWTVEDPAPSSGLATTPPPTVVTTQGKDQTITSGQACDTAGNCATGHYTLSIDTTDPVLTCPSPEPVYLLNSATTQMAVAIHDTVSGTTATTAAAAVVTGQVGEHTTTASGRDIAGRTASVTCHYRVSYQVSEQFQAAGISPPPTINTAKAGSTIPLQWTLTDANGAPITDPASFDSIRIGSTTCDPTQPLTDLVTSAGGSGLQYLGNGLWQYNWKTAKTDTGQCKVVRLALNGGQPGPEALIQFK